ncbi:MAG: ABC transporter substrate-binding protein [Spirochaetaceae bacterium]
MMKRSFRRMIAGTMLLVGCATVLFATGQPETEGEVGGIITIYTSVPQGIIDKIQADFMAKYPDIELEVFRAGTGAVIAKVATELEAGELLADLVWVAEPSTYEMFKDQGILLQFTPAEADALAEGMADPEGYYYAGRLINMIIGYNTDLVDDPPETWSDLLGSRYAGPKGMASPVTSGAALATAYAIAQEHGDNYFRRFRANDGVQARSNGAVRDSLSTGEYETGIVLDYMIRGRKAEGAPVDYVWPKDGTVFIPSPIAIFNTSSNIETAKVFVDYTLSAEGQRTLVELGNFIPIRDDVDPPEGAPRLGEIDAIPIDWAELSDQSQAVLDAWTALFAE